MKPVSQPLPKRDDGEENYARVFSRAPQVRLRRRPAENTAIAQMVDRRGHRNTRNERLRERASTGSGSDLRWSLKCKWSREHEDYINQP